MARRKTSKAAKKAAPLPDHRFFQLSQQPLQSLIFLLPLLIGYELGTLFYATNPRTGQVTVISARKMLSDALDAFGAGGYYLPGLLVVCILLAWHLVRRDPWRLHWRVYLWMGLESIVLTLPLLILSLVIYGRPAAGPFTWQQELVLSVGAGIYEELVFRLMAIALLHMVAVDLIKAPEKRGAWIAIIGSAAAFAAYHFVGTAVRFSLIQFLYYFVAGLYFAWIYVLRGFGVVVAVHVAFDIIIAGLKQNGWMGLD